ncbi:MAG: AMP-binding protein, partial [Rhodospirillales bacterium]|nr:AMP-binding protein [Rhodospirillales bacterium]
MILSDILRAAHQHYGTRPAIRDADGDLTWAELTDRVARTAACLAGLGLEPGGRFGVISANTYRAAALYWAGYWMGCVPVPVNWRLAPREIADMFTDAEVERVVVDDDFQGILSDGLLAPWRAGAVLYGPPGPETNLPNLEDGLVGAAPMAAYKGAEDDDAMLLYTGGTTGRAKGVRLTHRNIIANGQQNGFALGLGFGDIWLHAAPLFHSADLLGTPCTLMGGGHVYLPQFSPTALLECLQERRPTATVLPPTMLRMVMDAPDFDSYDKSALRLLYYGSSPMAAAWIREAMERFPGVEIFQGYGLTETTPILTVLDHQTHKRALENDELHLLASAGKPVAQVWLRIVDGDGQDVAPGEAGEVLARGPNVMKGYLNRPIETAQALDGGWLHTGDVG